MASFKCSDLTIFHLFIHHYYSELNYNHHEAIVFLTITNH
jgi:hypothetical protein